MPLNKVFNTVRSRVAQFVGPNDEIKWSIDTSPDPSELVLEDTVNSTELGRFPLNTQVEATFENNGSNELNVGGLSGELSDNQPPKTHSSTHNQDNADELFVENLGTALNSNEVPQSDGSGGLNGFVPSGASIEASESDTLTDITSHTEENAGDTASVTLLDITDSGTCLGGVSHYTDTSTNWSVDITIDGGTTQSIGPVATSLEFGTYVEIPAFKFDSSAKIVISSSTTNSSERASYVWVK